jgi:hypothetical protein
MRFLLAASLVLAASTARADAPAKAATGPAPDVKQMHTDDCAKARAKGKTCVIDMGKGDEVTGNVATGTGSMIGIIEGGKATSLIQLRRDFITEILKSAEDL